MNKKAKTKAQKAAEDANLDESALKTMRETTRRLNYRNRTELSLDDIAAHRR